MIELKKNAEFIVLFLILFVPSLRAIFKYLPNPELLSIFIGLILLFYYYFILRVKKINQILNKIPSIQWIFIVIISIFIIANYFIYPIADARKLVGKGSTGDDAIIEPVKKFLSTGKMYDVTLNGDVPVSPGPGWILLNSLFVICNSYYLFTPFYISISILLYLLLFKKKTAPIILLFLLSSSLIFWELMVTGHDLISLGFSFTLIIMLLFHYCIEVDVKTISIPIFLISIFIGFISTSRIVFLFLPFLTLILTYKFKLKQSLFIFTISISIAILLHFIFYITNDYYQPLHLFNRGKSNVGFPIMTMGALVTFVLVIIGNFRIQKSFESFLKWFFLLMVSPLSFISFGEFLNVDYNFAAWEGANYVVPMIPVYLVYISNKYAFHLEKEKPNNSRSEDSESSRLGYNKT